MLSGFCCIQYTVCTDTNAFSLGAIGTAAMMTATENKCTQDFISLSGKKKIIKQKSVRNTKCQDQKVSDLESVRIRKCQNLKTSKLGSARNESGVRFSTDPGTFQFWHFPWLKPRGQQLIKTGKKENDINVCPYFCNHWQLKGEVSSLKLKRLH